MKYGKELEMTMTKERHYRFILFDYHNILICVHKDTAETRKISKNQDDNIISEHRGSNEI